MREPAAFEVEIEEHPFRWSIEPLDGSAVWLNHWESFNRATWNTPLLSAPMLEPALQRFGNRRERLATARRGDRTVAMALVRPVSLFAWETFQPSQLPLATLMLAADESLEEIAASLLAALPPNALVLSIEQLDTKFLARPADGALADFLPHITTGAIELPVDRDAYFSSLPASLRKNVEKRTRRASEAVGEPRLDVFTGVGQVEEYLALYAATESSGWKGRIGTAVRTGDEQGDFYREMLLRTAQAGLARMFVLRFGDVAVAQQFAIEHAGVLYLMKTTYDERYKQYAPGVLQRFHVLRWAAKRPIDRVETYGRLNESQRPFITSAREIYHATFFRRRSVRQVRDALHRARGPGIARLPQGASQDPAAQESVDAAAATPFETAAWFELLERTCFASSPGRCIRIAARSNSGAFLPLWYRPSRVDGLLTGLSNFYTPLLSPTGTPAEQDEIALDLVRFLRETRGWSTLSLQPLADDAPWLATLVRELRRVGMIFDRYYCFGNWYVDVQDFDSGTFEKTLPSQLRHTLLRAEQRLCRLGGVEIDIRAGSLDADVLQRCIDDFLAVYGRSWKRAEPYARFIPDLFALASQRGWLRFACLRQNGRAIASQLWLTHSGVASIYKLAYDTTFGRYSPGSLLTRALIRHAIDEDHVRQIDYLIGDDAYKQSWMKSRRSRIGLVVFNRSSPAGLLRAARHYLGKATKRLKPHRANE